jgi:hypothetical protein
LYYLDYECVKSACNEVKMLCDTNMKETWAFDFMRSKITGLKLSFEQSSLSLSLVTSFMSEARPAGGACECCEQ